MKTLLPARAPVQAASRSGGGLLQRKCACGASTGNAGRCLDCERKKALGLQAKRVVGAVDDPAEREADRMAESVINPAGGADALAIRRRAVLPDSGVAETPASVDAVLARGGSPLEAGLRGDMERRFGHDFSQVRVHTDAAADRSARELHAHAYTAGRHIVFAAGRYAPQGAAGRRLLAHELTHVVQQGEGGALLQRQLYRPFRPAAGADELVGRRNRFRCSPSSKIRAQNFQSYQSLLKCAELRMGRGPREMLAVFRQLYYGKPWSNSTASQWDQVIPCSPDIGDPRLRLGNALFDSLKASQSVGGVDFGHVFAGLEAMTCPSARVTPKVSSRAGWMKRTAGGAAKVVGLTTVMTANEDFATWAGDLGSAVAAWGACRVLGPEAKNHEECGRTEIPGPLSRYLDGLASSDDLEGDIDPFVLRAQISLIPCGGSRLKTLTLGSRPISDVFRDYYQDDPSRWPGGARAGHAICFLKTLGGVFDGGGRLTNEKYVIDSMVPSIFSFAVAYYTNMIGFATITHPQLLSLAIHAFEAARWFIRRVQWRL